MGALLKTAERLARAVLPRWFKRPARAVYLWVEGKFIVIRHVCAEDATEVRNRKIVLPPRRVTIASPANDPFVPLGKYYREGWCDCPAVYVCEVPQAKVHLPSGLVCTRDFKVLTDRHLEDRMHSFAPYGGRRPRKVARLFGTCTTLNYCYAGNLWHWLVDCLPKIHTLEKAGVGELTVLMSTTARAFQRETLERILPASMRPRYEHGTEWIEVENFLWVSLVSHRCMGFLPGDYYEAMRGPIFRSLGLDRPHEKRERIYISRAKAAHRRVKNDDEVAGFLAGYGFRRVHLEAVSFREEVELFHGAEAVVGPHGAGLGDIIYSGDISVGVLYPTRVPPNYFHSLACGLGQRHHFLCHDEAGEDDDFEVDLGRLKQLIEHGMRLQ